MKSWFISNPYDILAPDQRRAPDAWLLTEENYLKFLPPLVHKIREKVFAWRANEYQWASNTSKSLLKRRFQKENTSTSGRPFQYSFAQREAIETVIYLHEVEKFVPFQEFPKYDGSGQLKGKYFDEDWTRYVIKMATGAGKTKVLSLIMVWSFFHKMYEEYSTLSRNFLLIAPNIIVLDRLKWDFEGLSIFFTDPAVPENGRAWHDWKTDFSPVKVHLQDDVSTLSPIGNIFLTNIHRVSLSHQRIASPDDENLIDYFIWQKAMNDTRASDVDLGKIVREVDELMILNDEAHHIWDSSLSWFKNIQDIVYGLRQRGLELSLHIDVTATPKNDKWWIFPQTITDYPLAEAIAQNIVKTPLIPRKEDREKLVDSPWIRYSERFKNHIDLWVIERQKSHEEYQKQNKKAVLFVMTDDTKNCDEVAEYLENTYTQLAWKVLVIHTKKNWDLAEGDSKQNQDELKKLREAANNIDHNQYLAVVSVLMLREWWDVKNVTTIVWLRQFTTQNEILPEQTIGRGLRRIDRNNPEKEYLTVIGTDAFMQIVEKLRDEWVKLEEWSMWWSRTDTSLLIDVDDMNPHKDISKLDIAIPIMTNSLWRDTKEIGSITPESYLTQKMQMKHYPESELHTFSFVSVFENDATVKESIVDFGQVASSRDIIDWYTKQLIRKLRLGHMTFSQLYPKVKQFVQYYLFETPVDLDDLQTAKNLTDNIIQRTIMICFEQAINNHTIKQKDETTIMQYKKLSSTREFWIKPRSHSQYSPKFSIFNTIVWDSEFEVEFAQVLDYIASKGEIVSFAKNYQQLNIWIDYQDTKNNISHYYPDFFVKHMNGDITIIETKGREEVNDLKKVERLRQFCLEASMHDSVHYKALYIKQEDFESFAVQTWKEIISLDTK